jgi:hypothetical protein
MKTLLFILLGIFTLSESYLIYGFYRYQLNILESIMFTVSGLTLLITTLFLGYYKKGLRIASKGLFTLLCLIGMWFNLLSIKNVVDYKPLELKQIPKKESWNQYHDRGHSWIAYKEYVENDYRIEVKQIQEQNKEIKKQNEILYSRYKNKSEIKYNEIVFFVGRGLFSILLIFAIDLIVILIQSQNKSQSQNTNKINVFDDQSQDESQANHNVMDEIIRLSKEKYSNGSRKYTNKKIASLVDCDISFVDKLIQKRKYNKTKTKIYRIK